MSKVVLIAEDSRSVRQMLLMVLKSKGYKVIEAENGKLALDQLNGQHIDLIVTDVNMPEMDGLDFIAGARGIAAYRTTPILMLTTESDPALMERAKALGVKGWMKKPFQPPTFLSTIEKVL